MFNPEDGEERGVVLLNVVAFIITTHGSFAVTALEMLCLLLRTILPTVHVNQNFPRYFWQMSQFYLPVSCDHEPMVSTSSLILRMSSFRFPFISIVSVGR